MYITEEALRLYSSQERQLLMNAHRKLFKERLKIALDARVGRNGKNCCFPEYHAQVSGIHRTTFLRYLSPYSRIVPSFDNLCILIEYIKTYIKDFNPAFLFEENAPMTLPLSVTRVGSTALQKAVKSFPQADVCS